MKRESMMNTDSFLDDQPKNLFTLGSVILGMLVFGCALFIGCGGVGEVSVSGKVTLDGAPLKNATIIFAGEGHLPTCMATTSEDGSYVAQTGQLKGLLPGSYKVTVVVWKTKESTSKMGEPKQDLVTPKKYANAKTSGLTAEITSSNYNLNFDLKSE